MKRLRQLFEASWYGVRLLGLIPLLMLSVAGMMVVGLMETLLRRDPVVARHLGWQFSCAFRSILGSYVEQVNVPADPWDSAHPYRLRRGERQFFRSYLNAESSVLVRTPDEVAQWLLHCESWENAVVGKGRDVIAQFERSRGGSQEDHAYWAWKRLHDLGYEPELVIGYRDPFSERVKTMWVTFSFDGVEYVLDPAAKRRHAVLLPLVDIKDRLLPLSGIRGDLSARRFAGYVQLLRRVHAGLQHDAQTALPH